MTKSKDIAARNPDARRRGHPDRERSQPQRRAEVAAPGRGGDEALKTLTTEFRDAKAFEKKSNDVNQILAGAGRGLRQPRRDGYRRPIRRPVAGYR